jgi:cytochrome c biogenesis protein CcdA
MSKKKQPQKPDKRDIIFMEALATGIFVFCVFATSFAVRLLPPPEAAWLRFILVLVVPFAVAIAALRGINILLRQRGFIGFFSRWHKEAPFKTRISGCLIGASIGLLMLFCFLIPYIISLEFLDALIGLPLPWVDR